MLSRSNALVFQVLPKDLSAKQARFESEELLSLVRTAGTITVQTSRQSRAEIDYRTYVRPEIVDEISTLGAEKKINLLIVNNILKSGQIFALSEILRPVGIQVWDRIDLILEIFSLHAQSAEAKLQIDLARIRHMGPRIFGMGIELSRQGGGIGTVGIGETNLEIMRRHLKEHERRILKKLEQVQKAKDFQRQRREREYFKTVAIVGYTNAGKSELMRALTKKEHVNAEDALFATLDTRIGRLFLPDVLKNVLVSDTIGFIANLSPDLISAFTSTLSEAVHADLLLHIVDVSDPRLFEKITVVDGVLEQLKIQDKPQILIGNKIDRAKRNFGKKKVQTLYPARTPLFISAKEKTNLAELKSQIARILFPNQLKTDS